jgi:carbonic anhydrase
MHLSWPNRPPAPNTGGARGGSPHTGGLDRRTLLKLGGSSLIAAVMESVWPQGAIAAPNIAPAIAYKTLMEGNQRFVSQNLMAPHRSADRRLELAQSQRPIATILSCADSRVPAELLFDVGLGDIFNVRVAGNIVTPAVLASLEYAVELLETPLLMILGHERCGAVSAAVQGQPVPGHIGDLLTAIQPAVAQTKDLPGDPIDNAVIANVQIQIDRLLAQSPLISRRQAIGQVMIVGARYDLDSGVVTVL